MITANSLITGLSTRPTSALALLRKLSERQSISRGWTCLFLPFNVAEAAVMKTLSTILPHLLLTRKMVSEKGQFRVLCSHMAENRLIPLLRFWAPGSPSVCVTLCSNLRDCWPTENGEYSLSPLNMSLIDNTIL
jgi:hypothetical protein